MYREDFADLAIMQDNLVAKHIYTCMRENNIIELRDISYRIIAEKFNTEDILQFLKDIIHQINQYNTFEFPKKEIFKSFEHFGKVQEIQLYGDYECCIIIQIYNRICVIHYATEPSRECISTVKVYDNKEDTSKKNREVVLDPNNENGKIDGCSFVADEHPVVTVTYGDTELQKYEF